MGRQHLAFKIRQSAWAAEWVSRDTSGLQFRLIKTSTTSPSATTYNLSLVYGCALVLSHPQCWNRVPSHMWRLRISVPADR